MASKLSCWLLALLLLAAPAQTRRAQAQTGVRAAGTSSLWVDVSLGAPLVEWFNRTARPDDIARIDHLPDLGLLEQVQVGRRLVVFKSIEEAERYLPQLAGRVEIVGYNLEHGPANLPHEQADPVGSVRRMRALADRYQLALAFGPDRRFALDVGVDAAPYVDLFILQVQRVQTNAQTVREFVEPLVTTLRRANPELEVGVQFAAEGDAAAITALVESLSGSLDGVSLLTDHESTERVEAVVRELRPQPAPLPDLATPVPAATAVQPAGADLPLPSATERPPVAPSAPAPRPAVPTPVAQAVSPADPVKQWVWLAVGLLIVVVIGVVITSAIHLSQRPAGR